MADAPLAITLKPLLWRVADLTGMRFGRWLVVSLERRDELSHTHWLCRCDCGSQKVVRRNSLIRGASLSCGCLKAERCRQIHGKHYHSSRRTYRIWTAMKQRCLNPNHTNYQHYGARGITVCEEWRSEYRNFLSDMGEAPRGLTLERIDNEGDYCKSNCCWATRRVQSLNKRSTVFITINGKQVPLMDAAEKAGITRNCAEKRLQRGWGMERTFGISQSL